MPNHASRKSSKGLSFIKSLGTTLGILGGLLALAKGGYELWQEAHKSPDVDLVTGEDPLNVTYDPLAKTLQFSFNIAVLNNGTASDAIRGGDATIDRMGAAPIQLLTSQQVTFYDSDQTSMPLRLPVILSTNYQKTLHCVVSSGPGQQLGGSDDMSQLQLSITGTTRAAHTAKLCFYLTDAAVDQLLETQHASFVAPKHCGGSQ
jgi:hypothetical protein